MVFQCDAVNILPPLMELAHVPWQRCHQSGWGEEDPFHQSHCPDNGEPQRQACLHLIDQVLHYMIKSCITLATEASSVTGVWGGRNAVRDAMT